MVTALYNFMMYYKSHTDTHAFAHRLFVTIIGIKCGSVLEPGFFCYFSFARFCLFRY